MSVVERARAEPTMLYARLRCECVCDGSESPTTSDEDYDEYSDERPNRKTFEVVVEFDDANELHDAEENEFDEYIDDFNDRLPQGWFCDDLIELVGLVKHLER